VVEEAGIPGETEPPTIHKQLVNFITCSCESSAPFLSFTTKKTIQHFNNFALNNSLNFVISLWYRMCVWMFKTTDSKIASQCETGSTFLGNSEPQLWLTFDIMGWTTCIRKWWYIGCTFSNNDVNYAD
jgi:hypothetical protein